MNSEIESSRDAQEQSQEISSNTSEKSSLNDALAKASLASHVAGIFDLKPDSAPVRQDRKYDNGNGGTASLRSDRELPVPVSWRELAGILFGIALADAAIYHGAGFAGFAAAMVGWALFLWFAVEKPVFSGRAFLFFGLLMLIALKLLWCGFVSAVAAGFFLVFLFGLVQVGKRFRLIEVVEYAFQVAFGGGSRINEYGRVLASNGLRLSGGTLIAVGLPLVALIVFGTIFVLANPSLVEAVQNMFNNIGNYFSRFYERLPGGIQVIFWIATCWLLVGSARPYNFGIQSFFQLPALPTGSSKEGDSEPVRSPFYSGCRNTLASVIVLFVVYLVFEFETLWFRTFPEGFCYSDYSHQGAAWLVVALAVSTIILSLVFRPSMFRDPRIATLRGLAWVWSGLNFVLAVAIYNRLFIYIQFNGMTRMRVVGLLGMTAVLIGFVMVVRKIAGRHDFSWLLRRFTWTVLAMIFLDVVLPVDWLVHSYNVARIIDGNKAPSVQLSVHPCSNEGYLAFLPLAQDYEDKLIRDGVRAKLALKLHELNEKRLSLALDGKKYSWTACQVADEILSRKLEARRVLFDEFFEDRYKAGEAVKRFDEYAYRWY